MKEKKSGRVMAIDYGLKRVGVAVSDPLKIISSPLTTVSATEILDFIRQYCQKEAVEEIVVGLPVNLQNEATDATAPVIKFIGQLEKAMPDMKVSTMDERFTSKIAFDTLLQAGVRKKQRRDKKLIDKISASLILQTYLERL
ncbi:MAG: Holliday junction resolvase RuvX [Cyclobacteriaceae bacterium]|nr:Holliday junction resolvase RuvX [Cyclobacteriaceae bacterium]